LSSTEEYLWLTTRLIEKSVETRYKTQYRNNPNPPPIEQFKAAVMEELARRVQNRALTIQKDWLDSTPTL
jgi:hypothetical protein